jgi:hypothetical protein
VPVQPTGSSGPCDGIATPTTGEVTAPTWIVLALTSNLTTLAPDGAAVVTGSLARNSAGAVVSGVFTDGTPLPMTATGGALAFADPPLVDGVATTLYRSSSPAGRSATAAYSHERATVTWPDATSPGSPAETSPPTSVAAALSTAPDALPDCTRDVAITDVTTNGRRVTIRGLARLRRAGQQIRLVFQPTGDRTVARPRVGADGRWTATVTRPRSVAATSNRARYRAILGSTRTPFVKISRRVARNEITYAADRLRIRGRVDGPLVTGARAAVLRADACGTYRTIGSIAVRRDGTYDGTATVAPKTDEAVFLRLRLRVRAQAGGPATTFSITKPVLLR